MKVPSLSTRKKSIIAVALVLGLGGTTFAAQQALTTGAEEPNPIIEQVGQHEERIGTLESRADQTDQKVEQNTSQIDVVKREVAAKPSNAAPVSSTPTTTQPSSVASAPAAAAPAPEPPKNPRMITSLIDTPTTNDMHVCDYDLYDPGQNVTLFIQPTSVPCQAVGEVLPYV